MRGGIGDVRRLDELCDEPHVPREVGQPRVFTALLFGLFVVVAGRCWWLRGCVGLVPDLSFLLKPLLVWRECRLRLLLQLTLLSSHYVEVMN